MMRKTVPNGGGSRAETATVINDIMRQTIPNWYNTANKIVFAWIEITKFKITGLSVQLME